MEKSIETDQTSGYDDVSPSHSGTEAGPFRRMEIARKLSLISSNLVGVIQAGTNTISFSVYTTPDFKVVCFQSEEIQLFTPQDGWFEQDPIELMEAIYSCCEKVCDQLPSLGYNKDDIKCIGIANQRETTVVWDTITGEPMYRALVWNDIRTTTTVDQILARVPEQNKNHFKSIAGLPVSPYFSALKIRWLKDNVPAIRKACRGNHCKAGTIDSWIVWNLTKGSAHITDVTNASRTLLMNIDTLLWDPILLKTFSIHINMLPEIRSCSEIYARISNERSVLNGVPISGILGNQQASLLGQMCLKPGQAKCTYRSGCFLLCNTGEQRIDSAHGLLTTVAYKLGPDEQPTYALEGAIAVGGHALEWLQNKVRLLSHADDAEKIANEVASTNDVYFVPAFTGLYAPYWRKDARGIIIGLTQFTKRQHIVRATLESICFQTRDILECMNKEGGFTVNKLHADGDLSSNSLLMQLQADTAGVPVLRSQLHDSAAYGVAMCAAQARGIDLCRFGPQKFHYENVYYDTFLPTTTDEQQEQRYSKWKRAVERSMGWALRKKSKIMTTERYNLLGSIPASVFLMSVFAMLVHSRAFAGGRIVK